MTHHDQCLDALKKALAFLTNCKLPEADALANEIAGLTTMPKCAHHNDAFYCDGDAVMQVKHPFWGMNFVCRYHATKTLADKDTVVVCPNCRCEFPR